MSRAASRQAPNAVEAQSASGRGGSGRKIRGAELARHYDCAMKIYTKTGDEGHTALFGGERVPKHDPRIEACGGVDECNALLGVARSQSLSPESDATLQRIQHELFALGAELATPAERRDKLGLLRIDDARVEALEAEIDRGESALEPLRNFILPGGHPGASALHHARTVCRRAERAVVSALETIAPSGPALRYLNRLSDLLFVLARVENRHHGVSDVLWSK